MILLSLPAHSVGCKTLISHGPTDRGQAKVNHKKVQRLWREEGLRVPQRRRRKRRGSSTAR
ncbi:hypothetical protein B1T50_01925, partial [Mycobacterium kansasii]